jgi:glutamate-1-semialdehyde 2,1-aminomutase
LGKREIMEAAQKTFISSTFWTEKIGPSAALKTLELMEREKSWDIITKIGYNIRDRLQKIADNHKIKIMHWGLPALTGFTILNKNELASRTFITQEMLNKGYLAGNCIYVSTKHTPAIIDGYFERLNEIFKTLSNCHNDEEILSLIKGEVCEPNFKRLT